MLSRGNKKRRKRKKEGKEEPNAFFISAFFKLYFIYLSDGGAEIPDTLQPFTASTYHFGFVFVRLEKERKREEDE